MKFGVEGALARDNGITTGVIGGVSCWHVRGNFRDINPLQTVRCSVLVNGKKPFVAGLYEFSGIQGPPKKRAILFEATESLGDKRQTRLYLRVLDPVMETDIAREVREASIDNFIPGLLRLHPTGFLKPSIVKCVATPVPDLQRGRVIEDFFDHFMRSEDIAVQPPTRA